MPSVITERDQFIDEDTGELIVNGYIYIGTQNLDAKLNTITIYPDRALSGTPLANPQRTGSDGRALNKIWIPGKYSMKVEDSNNAQKLNDLDRGEDPQTGNTKLINVLGVNDLVADASPTITTLIDSQAYIFSAPAAPTGAMTLKIDSTPIKNIKKGDGLAIEANDFAPSQKIVVVYNEADDWYEVTSGVLSSVFGGNVTIGETLTVEDIVINNSATGEGVLDEDDMASDSDTKLATQQSIKAYIENKFLYGTAPSAAGNVSLGNVTWAVARPSTGLYTITHNLGHTNYHVQPSAQADFINVALFSKSINDFQLEIRDVTTSGSLRNDISGFLLIDFS